MDLSRRTAFAPSADPRKLRRSFYAPWQSRAWTFFDCWSSLTRGYTIKANTIAKVRLYPAWQAEPDDEPLPLDESLANPDIDTAGLTDAIAALAVDTIARVQSSDGGQPEILNLLALNLDVAGEGYLIARDEGWGEHWRVYSVEQVQWRGDGWYVCEAPDSDGMAAGGVGGTWVRLPDDAVALRIWRKHPRITSASTSAFRSLLPDLELANRLRSGETSKATSRIALNGILLVDSNIDLPSTQDQMGDAATAAGFTEVLLENGQTAVRDPESAAAQMPIVAEIEGQSDRKISEALHHQTFDYPMHEAQVRAAEALDRKIIEGADFPPEWVTGQGASSTFANARIVNQEGYLQDVDPTVLLICAGLTSAWLREVLTEAGVPSDVVRRLVCWRDPDSVISKPDRAKYAIELVKAGAQTGVPIISPAAALAATGFDPGDAATPEDVAAYRDATQSPLPDLSDSDGPNAGEMTAAAKVRAIEAPAVIAKRGTPTPARLARISSRLADIDARLLARLHVAADRAVADGLARAGKQIAARAQGSPACKAAIRGKPPRYVYAALSDDQRATLGAGAADLDGTLGTFADQFDRWTKQAQAQALRTAQTVGDWTDDETEAIVAQQDDDRAAGWSVLAAALLGLMAERLTAPDVVPPSVGEWDPSLTVPFGLTRAGVAVAGGATLDPLALGRGMVETATGVPAGAIGDGTLILDSLRVAASVGVEAHVWIHGGAPTPFVPHLDLDGQEFTSWEDPALLNDEGWPEVPYLRPGDHDSCSCSAEAVLVVSD